MNCFVVVFSLGRGEQPSFAWSRWTNREEEGRQHDSQVQRARTKRGDCVWHRWVCGNQVQRHLGDFQPLLRSGDQSQRKLIVVQTHKNAFVTVRPKPND